MKKSVLALLATAVIATGLAGCTPDPKETAQADQKTEETKQQAAPQAETTTTDASAQNGTDEWQAPAPNEPSHEELRKAFAIGSDYKNLPATAIVSIAMGNYEIPLDENGRFALAKALSAATGEIGWKQEDAPPGIFLKPDGSGFSIGYKRQSGEMVMANYEAQADGSYKNVKQETK